MLFYSVSSKKKSEIRLKSWSLAENQRRGNSDHIHVRSSATGAGNTTRSLRNAIVFARGVKKKIEFSIKPVLVDVGRFFGHRSCARRTRIRSFISRRASSALHPDAAKNVEGSFNRRTRHCPSLLRVSELLW